MFYLALHQNLTDVHVCYRASGGRVFWFAVAPSNEQADACAQMPARWHEQKSASEKLSNLELFTHFFKEKGYLVEPVSSLSGLRGLLEQAHNVRADSPLLANTEQGILPAQVFTNWHILEQIPA